MVQIQILPLWLLEMRTSITLTTMSQVRMNQTCVSFPQSPFPMRVRNWANLGPLQIQLYIWKLETIMLPLLRPYVLAACQMRKKHTTFQTLSKESIVISSTSFWNWKNLAIYNSVSKTKNLDGEANLILSFFLVLQGHLF